jgi:hypothetical protein
MIATIRTKEVLCPMRYSKSKSYFRITIEPQAHRVGGKASLRIRRRGHNVVAGKQEVIGGWRTPPHPIEDSSQFQCFDTEDVEGLLVELGVGYFDRLGNYHDGNEPVDDYDEGWFDDEVPAAEVDDDFETESDSG